MFFFYTKTILMCILALFLYSTPGYTADQSSTNYKHPWYTVNGGGAASSGHYTLTSSVIGQSIASVDVSGVNYFFASGFDSLPNVDNDTVKDFMDNCILIANEDQRDTDGDGYGNRCDGDLNNDLAVNIFDFGILKTRFGTADPDTDFNGDGSVNIFDFGIFKQMFGVPPGPSGIAQ